MSEIVQPLRFGGVLCIAHKLIRYITMLASLGRYAQLTRCFSAVAELLVYQVTDYQLRQEIYLYN